MPEAKFRRVERMIGHEIWIPYEFEDLAIGDIFRMFESTGEPVLWEDVSVFEVSGAPEPFDPPGNFILHAEKAEKLIVPLQKQALPITVMVNDREWIVAKPTVSYDEIAGLVGDSQPTVTWYRGQRGHSREEYGSLIKGQSLHVREGLRITAVNTGAA